VQVKRVRYTKNVRSSWPTATIRPDMTVAELALVLDRDIGKDFIDIVKD
jgi:hypothetical protein